MISGGGILVCLGNVAIYAIILLLAGALIQWAFHAIGGVTIPPNVVKLFLLLVAVVAVVGIIACMISPHQVPRVAGGLAYPTPFLA
jgi:predicted membrane channel-forming protein YqfA (hemolysin III family)